MTRTGSLMIYAHDAHAGLFFRVYVSPRVSHTDFTEFIHYRWRALQVYSDAKSSVMTKEALSCEERQRLYKTDDTTVL